MRKIKYMAWDDSISKMIPWEELIKHCADGRLYYDFVGMFTRENYHYHLIEYVGIDDKEGNELYEKDIVEDQYGSIGVIEWLEEDNNPCFAIRWYADGVEQETGGFSGIKQWGRKIGNVYANPDLVPNYKE